MAGEAQNNIWPLPKFSFSVTIDGSAVSFQEVTGLDIEAQVIEYRAGDSKAYSTIKMPGLQKTSNVVMKKGVFAKDNGLWKWFSQNKMNTVKRVTVVVSLLDETGAPTMVWTLANAFAAKIGSTDLKADGNEVAIESLEIAHEGITIANG
jgi:phage tail-like protein